MGRKVVAFLQARTDSTRLPGKVLKPLLDKPMIIHELERVSRSKLIDDLILLTSLETSDDDLANIVRKYGYKVFRGSKDNVLERFYKCSKELELNGNDLIIRLTGDCPVHDAIIIDELVEAFLSAECDYMANCVQPVYPDGLDAEVFTFNVLKQSYKEATKASQKEHVTPYIRDSRLFKIENLKKEQIHEDWRLTVDEASDFEVIEKIYNYFQSNNFTFKEMVFFLENHINILEINSDINRNEGYLKSLKEDMKNG